MWLFLTAVLMQGLDAQSTCYNINHGFKESNILMGHTCKSVIIRKSILFTPYVFVLDDKWGKRYSIALMTGGAIGFTLNVSKRK